MRNSIKGINSNNKNGGRKNSAVPINIPFAMVVISDFVMLFCFND